MRTATLRPVIDAVAAWVGLPSWTYHNADPFTGSEWLEGLILHESSGDPMAVHHDAAPDDLDHTSFGLMQIEGVTAKALGCSDFNILFLPLTNISFGLRVLTANLTETGGDVATALARYNGGGHGNPVGGPFRNQSYVDAVARNASVVQLARA